MKYYKGTQAHDIPKLEFDKKDEAIYSDNFQQFYSKDKVFRQEILKFRQEFTLKQQVYTVNMVKKPVLKIKIKGKEMDPLPKSQCYTIMQEILKMQITDIKQMISEEKQKNNGTLPEMHSIMKKINERSSNYTKGVQEILVNHGVKDENAVVIYHESIIVYS